MSKTFGEALAAHAAYRQLSPRAPMALERGGLWAAVVRLASSGIVIAGMGWFIILAVGTFIFSIEASSQDGMTAHAILLGRLAEALIVTGFGFAILDALDRNRRLGLRALSALHRQPDVQARPNPAPAPEVGLSDTAVGTGSLSGRDYTLFADGSLEIETILGRRRFASILDAREFITERS